MASRIVVNVGSKCHKTLQRAQDQLGDLSATVEIAEEKLYKDLSSELAKDEDLDNPRESYESVYVDILNRWTDEIHNIQVNIVQLAEWIEKEASHDFKELYNRKNRPLINNWNDQNKSTNNERMFSAKTQNPKIFHESVISRQTNPDNFSNRETFSREEQRDLLTVKLNRTMKLRKAENQRRQKATEGELFSFPSKRGRKKLDEYKLKYVYDRLHDTPTYASSCQRKARKSARSHGLFQQHSITTVRTLPLSRTQSPVKITNTRYGSGRPEKANTTAAGSTTKPSFLPPIKNKVPLVAQGGGQSRHDSEKNMTDMPSKLPRPLPVRKPKKSDTSNDKADASKSKDQLAVPDTGSHSDSEKPETKQSNGSAGKKKNSNSHWKKLLKRFSPRANTESEIVNEDDFNDMKSSFVDAQKIYGSPKPKVKSKKKEKQSKKSEKVENLNLPDQTIKKKSKIAKPKQTKILSDQEPADVEAKCDEIPENGACSDSREISTKQAEEVSILSAKSGYKKPKSAKVNKQVKQRPDKSSLNEGSDARQGANMKIKPRKSKSDNSLETNKEASDQKAKKKSKSDSKSQAPNVTANTINQGSNDKDIASFNILTKPTTKIRQKKKKKTTTLKQPHSNTQTKLDTDQQVGMYKHEKVAESSQDFRKSRNKPKSTIVRNAIAESEELNLGPSAEYVFTKFSDKTDAKAKLAKLDEKFRLQKARVESAVTRNRRDTSNKDFTDWTDVSGSDLSLARQDSNGSVPNLPTDFNGTALLRRRIDKLKEDFIRRTLETDIMTSDLLNSDLSPHSSSSPNTEDPEQVDSQLDPDEDSDFWPMSNVPKVFQKRPIVHTRAS